MHLIPPHWTRDWHDKRKRELPFNTSSSINNPSLHHSPPGAGDSQKTRPNEYQDSREQANSNHTRRSGQLNAKQQELLELQALAQRRLKGARANFSEGLKTARETKRDLEWTQKRVR
jgi:hypothetical protein